MAAIPDESASDEEPLPRRMPMADEAEIDPQKLYAYALSPHHPAGRHKARVFAAALDIERCDWRYLQEQILDAVGAGEVVRLTETEHGTSYTVRVMIEGLNGRTCPVITAWMIRGEAPPTLSTTFVET